ncbi:MAG: response regulator [Lewinellaceae bacterium]|nr:response regulator [Lewinellaceae bacterium]
MKKRRRTGLLVFTCLALFSLRGLAQPMEHDMLVLSSADEQYQDGLYPLQDYLFVFVDKVEGRTIQEVAAPAFQPLFSQEERWRAGAFAGDLGPEIHYIWGRLTILSQLDEDEEWLINFDAGMVDLFMPIDSNRFAHLKSGESRPLGEKPFKGIYGTLSCMPLRLPAQDTLTVFFRLKRIGAVGKGMRSAFGNALFKPHAYFAVDRHIRFFDALMIGIMLAVAIYHLIIFLYQRQYVSLFFSLFVLAFAMIIMEYRGYASEILFPSVHLRSPIVVVPVTWSLVYLFHYGFSRLYLQLPKLLPVWDKIWAALVLVDIISGAMLVKMVFAAGEFSNVAPGPFFKLVSFRVLANLPLLLTILIAAAAAWFKGNKGAGIYLAAMLTYVLQEFANNVNAWFGFLNLPSYVYGYVGQTLMVLLFAMGIARQLKTLQEEKSAAEQAQLAERAENTRIRELDAFKSRFYTNITHQFRTPLTIILGMADQIQAHPSAWLNKGPEMIRRNGRRLLQLVDQILTLSRLESGHLPAHLVQDDVIRYIKYIVESFHSSAEQKNIQLKFTSGLEELVIDYDPDKLMDILSNLISNAIKFTPRGGEVKVEVGSRKSESGSRKAEALTISVADNGPGISKEALPHIFERFYQATGSPSPPSATSPLRGDRGGLEGAGTGIGLALTRELVHFLKGEIAVESEPGKGTVFSITLPITHNATAGYEYERSGIKESVSTYIPTPEAAGQAGGKATGHEQYTVLLVEDNRDVVEYISTVLSSRFHIVAEYDGQQGLARALILIPDIIISDIMMPAMDGLEMSRQLKADRRTSHIPIILLTAKADIASRIEGLQTGADAYLAKPFAPEELQAQIDNLIELRARLQERYRDLSFLFQPQHTLPDEDIHSEDHFMRELHGLIRDNLSDPDFSIGQLCEQIGISRASLYKKFKALSNQSIADFIRRVRLHKARQLLETTQLNITQVAIDVGFKNLSTFSRNFTEEFGVNPSRIKKEHKF